MAAISVHVCIAACAAARHDRPKKRRAPCDARRV